MKLKGCFLKKRFWLLLITLGIGGTLYANNELKLLTDSLRRVIDEKHIFVQKKEDRINRIKCMLKSSGLTLEENIESTSVYTTNIRSFISIPPFIMWKIILKSPVN